jgi:RHS repeat-associated protein
MNGNASTRSARRLLSDGVKTYTYDSSNRLIEVDTGDGGGAEYTYNGLGDRLTETAPSPENSSLWETKNYTLDLNTDLTQVLSDGTTTYTYGLGRISQQSGSTPEYFLGDALGSVRQMTDQAGGITFARNYDPYGVVTYTGGTSQTEFGFTGEQHSGELLYLRARYYSPAGGRFMSRDTWGGDYNRPLSLNRWMYVEGNPVNLVDPTGYSPDCDCLIKWSVPFPEFIGTGVFGYDYDEWVEWPYEPSTIFLSVELWTRHIYKKELGDSWYVERCLMVNDSGTSIITQKVSLVSMGVIHTVGKWTQHLVIVQIWQIETQRYQPYSAGWSIEKDMDTKIDLPLHAQENGNWPYSDLIHP